MARRWPPTRRSTSSAVRGATRGRSDFGLLAALAVCVAFWVMAGLTVFWLI
jgi:hypothetical protein